MRILLVEDDPMLSGAVARALRQSAHAGVIPGMTKSSW